MLGRIIRRDELKVGRLCQRHPFGKGWKVEGWKVGGLKVGRLEGWKFGSLEVWKVCHPERSEGSLQ
jgi:hypothetical protein